MTLTDFFRDILINLLISNNLSFDYCEGELIEMKYNKMLFNKSINKFMK